MNAIVKARPVSERVMSILADGVRCDGQALTIVQQLARPDYEGVNKVLEAIGGKWNRKAKAHLFDIDAADALDPVLLTATVTFPADFGFFETPPDLVERVIVAAGIKPGMKVLEPSAGTGNLAVAAGRLTSWVDCVELQADKAAQLRQRLANEAPSGLGFVWEGDFLDMTLSRLNYPIEPYDRVVMNPPFARQSDVKHVLHARKFLKPDGLLVAIMSAGITFRSDRQTRLLHNLVHIHGGTIEKLPERSFRTAGTDVNTVIVRFPNAGIQPDETA